MASHVRDEVEGRRPCLTGTRAASPSVSSAEPHRASSAFDPIAHYLRLGAGLTVSTTWVEGRERATSTGTNCPVFALRPILLIVRVSLQKHGNNAAVALARSEPGQRNLALIRLRRDSFGGWRQAHPVDYLQIFWGKVQLLAPLVWPF